MWSEHAAAPSSLHAQAARNALDELAQRPSAQLGSFPTPIERHKDLAGRPIWIKRDDLCGLGRGGAKARKINLLVGHLKANGYDELITLVGNVTNLAFDLIPVLDSYQLAATLMVLDDPPLLRDDRERIFDGLLDRVQLLPTSRTQAAVVATRAWMRSKRAGRSPFVLLPGASHPVSVLGNALGFIEMVSQFEAMDVPPPSSVWVTAATGTTVAGFLLAERLLRASGRPPIHVIGVEAYGEHTARRTKMLISWTSQWLGLFKLVSNVRPDIRCGMLSGGFARFGSQLVRTCNEVAATLNMQIHGRPQQQ